MKITKFRWYFFMKKGRKLLKMKPLRLLLSSTITVARKLHYKFKRRDRVKGKDDLKFYALPTLHWKTRGMPKLFFSSSSFSNRGKQKAHFVFLFKKIVVEI
jgi:hypothetical protein